MLDLSGESTRLGDSIPGSGDLMDTDGNIIGIFDIHTVVTRSSTGEGRLFSAEYSFGDSGVDAIVVIGAEHGLEPGQIPDPERLTTYAVVGGTGQYKGARGECDVDLVGEFYTITCTFTVTAGNS